MRHGWVRESMTDVARWLVSSGFGQYAEAFAKNSLVMKKHAVVKKKGVKKKHH